jgi:hypothetical protein
MRLTLTLLLALFVIALTGCAQVLGPQTLTWSEADVNQMLAKRFPMDRRVLELLDVNVTQPEVKLLPGTNRLATDMHIQAVDRMFGSVFHGRITMESGAWATSAWTRPAPHRVCRCSAWVRRW